jgi:hypothetical protein
MKKEHSLLQDRKHRDAWIPRQAEKTLTADLAGLHNHIAWQLATDPRSGARNGIEAVAHATRACQLSDWKQATYLDTLAAAYAETGDFEQATHWQQRAVTLSQNKKDFQKRLAMFQAGVAIRESQKTVDFKQLDERSRGATEHAHSSDAETRRLGEVILLSAYTRMKMSPDRNDAENRPHFLKSIERLAQFYAACGRPEESVKWQRVAEFYRNEAIHEEAAEKGEGQLD